ncbi:hypothetical protein [uncultured Sphaerochaeta sp.]|uniref:hypothetical protein n=1 Tax=uncultured Sphaerochaeta sp. TaxID=886478 RepID=UPI002A0A32A7|nr:hypothetical protein [uncultured Sphaerochaeta sp.]
MRLWAKFCLGILIFSCFSVSFASEVFTASYTEDFDTTIYNIADFGISSWEYSIACHVGTLVVSRVAGYSDSLNGLRLERSGNFGNGNEFFLKSTKKLNGSRQFGSQLLAKVTSGSSTTVQKMNQGTNDPFRPQVYKFTQFPITIEFYLGIRNIQDMYSVQGVGFQFKNGYNLGSFCLYTNNLPTYWQWWWDQDGSNQTQIAVNGATNPLPFFSVDYNVGSNYYINRERPDVRINALFSIIQGDTEKNLDIEDITTPWPRKVGTASLELEGTPSSRTYGVTLTFQDGNGGTGNNFLLKDETEAYSIPFSLYLDGGEVTNSIPILWDGLSADSTVTKAITAAPVNLSESQKLPAGTYSDTVIVSITPQDSNLAVQ